MHTLTASSNNCDSQGAEERLSFLLAEPYKKLKVENMPAKVGARYPFSAASLRTKKSKEEGREGEEVGAVYVCFPCSLNRVRIKKERRALFHLCIQSINGEGSTQFFLRPFYMPPLQSQGVRPPGNTAVCKELT